MSDALNACHDTLVETCTVSTAGGFGELAWHEGGGWFAAPRLYHHFVARAMGPDGPYVAGTSATFRFPRRAEASSALEALLEQLRAEGWELEGEGRAADGSPMYRFRRP